MDYLKLIVALMPDFVIKNWRTIAAVIVVLLVGMILSKLLFPLIGIALLIVGFMALRKALSKASE